MYEINLFPTLMSCNSKKLKRLEIDKVEDRGHKLRNKRVKGPESFIFFIYSLKTRNILKTITEQKLLKMML